MLMQRLWIDPAALKADYAKSPPWLKKVLSSADRNARITTGGYSS